MTRTILILIAGLSLHGCAAPARETFATPPSPDRPAAATDHGVDIPTKDEPEARDLKSPSLTKAVVLSEFAP